MESLKPAWALRSPITIKTATRTCSLRMTSKRATRSTSTTVVVGATTYRAYRVSEPQAFPLPALASDGSTSTGTATSIYSVRMALSQSSNHSAPQDLNHPFVNAISSGATTVTERSLKSFQKKLFPRQTWVEVPPLAISTTMATPISSSQTITVH